MSALEQLLSPEIREFTLRHEKDDVAALGLKKPPNIAWPYPLVLDQIKARQKAALKIPAWQAKDCIVFPSANLIEQASSEATARYKASLVRGNVVVDLTAGAGVDFLALLENFEEGIAVEQNKEAAEILEHNLKILAAKKFEVRNTSAENDIENLPACDLIYIDPQRRSNHGKGLFKFEDCSPDILKILPRLKSKSVMIKTSPMLDIDAAIRQLQRVSAVHVIEWQGECREVIYLLKTETEETLITAVIINDDGAVKTKLSFTRLQESESPSVLSMPLKYLFEPSPAFQKAGCYKFLGQHYGLKKLHPHTHLYTSETPCPGFPGRSFEIIGLHPAGGKTLPFSKANLTIRNFPAETEALRKKLKLKEGSEEYLFACTCADESKTLIHARKA